MSHPYRASVIALQRGRLPPIGAAANRPSSHRGVVTPSDTGLATSHTTRGQETMHLTTNRGLGSRAHKNIMFRSPPTPCDILTTSPGTHPLLPSSPTPPNIQLTKNLKQHSVDHHQSVTSGSSRRAKSHGQDQMIQFVVCQDGPHSVTWCAIRRGHTWSMVGDVHGMTLGAGALAKHWHCGIYFHLTVLPHLGEQHGLAACHIPLWRYRPTQLSTQNARLHRDLPGSRCHAAPLLMAVAASTPVIQARFPQKVVWAPSSVNHPSDASGTTIPIDDHQSRRRGTGQS